MTEYVAVIPARSGSKRIPNKNIRMLCGKPLVVWTIEACLKVDEINRVFLSTDSLAYWDLVKSYTLSKKLDLDLRAPSDAGDDIKIFDYLKTNIQKFERSNASKLILTLPTCPLRTHKHISEAIKLSEEKEKPVFSACRYAFPISFAFKTNNKSWEPFFSSSPMITGDTRSQDQETAYHPNGAIYVRKIVDFLSPSITTLYENGIPYIMELENSVDIDNLTDFELAEIIMKRNLSVSD